MPLVVAVAQPRCIAHDIIANVDAHAALVRAAAARVVVFPEMSLTGYELDASPIAEDDPRLAPLVASCAGAGALALVGAPVHAPAGAAHIGVLAVDGDGARVAYRKMWLGGPEAEWFSPGEEPAVVEVDGWRLGLGICKDTGIPEHAAATAALGIDAYVAGVLEHAHEAHVPEERARRIAGEHHVWVAMASFAGSTGGGYVDAPGGSGIWPPEGVAVARAGPEVGAVVRAELTELG